jgi:hypothetical protein
MSVLNDELLSNLEDNNDMSELNLEGNEIGVRSKGDMQDSLLISSEEFPIEVSIWPVSVTNSSKDL